MELKTWLTAEGLTTTEFASRLGVTHSTIVRWTNGSRNPSLDMMRSIHRATNGAVSANDFMAGAA